MNELVPALVAALAELTTVEKGHTADAGAYSYGYADLGDIVTLTRPALAAHGLIALTPVHYHGDGLAVSVTIYHTSGEQLTFEPLPFPHGKDAQATGSLITYHRRYALLSALGMAAGEANPIGDYGDDDGAHGIPADEYTPGLRTSVEAAIEKLDPAGKAALRAWFATEDLPAVRRMTADQLTRTIDHLMAT